LVSINGTLAGFGNIIRKICLWQFSPKDCNKKGMKQSCILHSFHSNWLVCRLAHIPPKNKKCHYKPETAYGDTSYKHKQLMQTDSFFCPVLLGFLTIQKLSHKGHA
jgi:hypothetical protein